jgi:hypothetical protein
MIFYSISWAGSCAINSCIGTNPWTAASPSRADVDYCVNTCAFAGDTVNVPAGDGSETWTSNLTMTKGVNLIGPGKDKLTITFGGEAVYGLTYTPSDYSQNWPLRISGFTFDGNAMSKGISLTPSNTNTTIQTKIRIDSNDFRNIKTAIWVNGQRGVIDNNTFAATGQALRFSYGYGSLWWNNWEGVVFGKADNNMYVEDNTFQIDGDLVQCDESNRYLFRYNDIISVTSKGSYTLMDYHGNQGFSNMYACFGGEIYGNKIGIKEGQLLALRGGKALLFNNAVVNFTGSVLAVKIYEEVWDDYNPTTNSQPQHPSDSYFWNNRKNYNGTLLISYLSGNVCASKIAQSSPTCTDTTHGYSINENREWYQDNAPFNGTAGIGCGTLANRPATCKTGVAYWATDQSCSNLDGMVGKNPSTPIKGTLFKCTAPNTWTNYYIPYAYPHPLRETSSLPKESQSPSPPKNLTTSP